MVDLVSVWFLLFFGGTLLVYYLLPWKLRWGWLLTASLAFFTMACGWRLLPYLAYGVIVSYTGARIIEERCVTERGKQTALFVTLLLLVAQLVALKYLNFFVNTGNIFGMLFDIPIGLKQISIVAPLGISYYTLSIIGYVVDVYRKTSSAQRNLLKHTLFTCYFPQMVSGPITRYEEMEPQLFSRHDYDYHTVLFGLQRMLWGFFKKMVIADRLAIFVSAVYADYYTYSGFYLVIAVLFYAVRLYTDFSGCMDILIGASETFGIRLPENFDAPFASQTIPEFWRRWHITLGLWTKDYILYPILKSDRMQAVATACKKRFGKKWGKKIPTHLGLAVVWLLIGIWHGGSYKFLFISGIYPGFCLILSDFLQPVCQKLNELLQIRTDCFSFRLFRRLRTALVVCICWTLLPASSLLDGFRVFKQMVTQLNLSALFHGDLFRLGLTQPDFILLFFCLFTLLIVEAMHAYGIHIRETLDRQNLWFRWAIMLLGVFGVLIFGIYGPGYNPVDFIYGGF